MEFIKIINPISPYIPIRKYIPTLYKTIDSKVVTDEMSKNLEDIFILYIVNNYNFLLIEENIKNIVNKITKIPQKNIKKKFYDNYEYVYSYFPKIGKECKHHRKIFGKYNGQVFNNCNKEKIFTKYNNLLLFFNNNKIKIGSSYDIMGKEFFYINIIIDTYIVCFNKTPLNKLILNKLLDIVDRNIDDTLGHISHNVLVENYNLILKKILIVKKINKILNETIFNGKNMQDSIFKIEHKNLPLKISNTSNKVTYTHNNKVNNKVNNNNKNKKIQLLLNKFLKTKTICEIIKDSKLK